MTHIAVLHYLGATQRSRSVVASIVSDLLDESHQVSLVDIGAFTAINQDLPPNWIVRLLRHRTYIEKFPEALTGAGASIYKLVPGETHSVSPPDSRWPECEQAIDSELLTYFRRDNLDKGSLTVRRMRKLLTRNTLAMFSELHHWLVENSPDELLIPNGRTSRQKAARICAEELGIRVKFYENGRARRDSYYLGNTQPHDRVASQKEVPQLTAGMSAEDISALAKVWLGERMDAQSGTNTFSGSWDMQNPAYTEAPGRPQAVFFTSSADEFLAFGPMWNIDSWNYQFEAFELMMEILSAKGCGLTLRVHPNLVGKSRPYFRATVSEIHGLQRKFPQLTVFWHNSAINSYELARSADYVIAERSTIGLEANLMGKPVWINQAAQWDKIADVRQLLSPDQINPSVLTPWKVDVSSAGRFVAYWMAQEKPLRYSWRHWSSWEPEKAPLPLKIATLFARNPWFHRWHLIKLEWTKWVNQRFSEKEFR